MVKIVWLLKRAPHLSPQEFERWWIDHHVPIARSAPRLRRYVVNLPSRPDQLAGKPATECEWDGVAEQWFDSVEAYKAAYSADPSPTRADTLAHTSRFARMVVTEQAYACEKRVKP